MSWAGLEGSANTIQPLGYRRRERSAAFDDPQVRAAFSRMSQQLRESNKKSGDLKKDIHFHVTIPLFTRQRAAGGKLATLYAGGTTSARGRNYPSSHYGWMQEYFTKYVVDGTIAAAMQSIVSPRVLTGPRAPKDVTDFKRKFGNEIRRWWVINRGSYLPQIISTADTMFQSSPIQRAIDAALAAKQAGVSVPQYLNSHGGRAANGIRGRSAIGGSLMSVPAAAMPAASSSSSSSSTPQ